MRTKPPTAQQTAAKEALDFFRMAYTYGWMTVGYNRELDEKFTEFASTLDEAELVKLKDLLGALRQFQHENPNPHPKPRD